MNPTADIDKGKFTWLSFETARFKRTKTPMLLLENKAVDVVANLEW
jgi:hypothetical protein